ncbi:unnamed protein product [Tuber melanosporum]|uniref:(Perigord truffle) hypothetical protein n=1 Tax=Tuber melanosporum (strain Mel28) TaxID=656061 RepID=D5G5X6_TUBMM|nr:uncharacterized protein GSTUM_00001613001 [Tuber melanosporum]CAZ79919.1 unnamed protein product [Tuber melanosporum]
MTDSEVYFTILRVSAAQTLRSAGITAAKPSVVDAFTDLLARYLTLLGTTTRNFAESGGRTQAELIDARMAMEHVGLLRPINIFSNPDDDDTEAVDALVEWFRGPQAADMRRVAGHAEKEGQVGKSDEWLGATKKLSEKRNTTV